MPHYAYDAVNKLWLSLDGLDSLVEPPPPPPNLGGPDWNDQNVPWASVDTAQYEAGWPAGLTETELVTGSGDLYQDLSNTLAPYSSSARVVVTCSNSTPHVHHLSSFRKVGSGSSTLYAFGFWFSKLQGWKGLGPLICHIQMDANSYSGAQLSELQAMKGYAANPPVWNPLQAGLCRLDGVNASSPVLLAGVTFRADDQQMMTSVGEGVGDPLVATPQPAPHQGVVLYQGTYARLNYCRFQAAGRALTSAPPFEMANLTTQYGNTVYSNVEFDGRISADLNPAQPRRCGPWMGNNETLMQMTDVWLHHSNVSRYAVNDQNRDTQGQYIMTRVKANQITNNHNVDPALNGGASLGGYTNATPFGFESCNGTITFNDCMIEQDNTFTDGSIAQHIQFTSVGSRDPQGGRLTVTGGKFTNAWPSLDGFLCIRCVTGTYWYRDGFDTTMHVYHPNGQRLTAYQAPTTPWPPSASSLASAGVTPETHFIVRTS